MNSPKLSVVPKTKRQSYRFDIFKGAQLGNNSVQKLKSVGAAILLDGQRTYTVYLNTFVNEVFYLLPAEKRYTTADYVIMSRQASTKPGKKFIWRPVGEGRVVSSEMGPLVHLSWDLFSSHDIFMNTNPNTQSVESAVVESIREALNA